MNNFNFPTLQELVERIQNDVKTQLPQSNPWLDDSWIRSMIIGYAGRFSENYLQLNNVRNSLFIGTSLDNFLDEWGKVYNIPREAAASSGGFVTATGTVGAVIPQNEPLSSPDGILYETQTETTIATQSLNVTLSRAGAVVTVVTASPHTFASGLNVTISGALSTEYNGTFSILVIDDTTFTYTIQTTPSTPDSGVASADVASIEVIASSFGEITNQVSGTNLTFSNLITNVASIALVQADGLAGGNDQESADDYRTRIIFQVTNPGADNSVNGIKNLLFTINGITRIFVIEGVGTYTVYFVRDNDPNIIPTPFELEQARQLLIADDYRPAHLPASSIFVLAPTPVIVDFTFTSLTPNTSTMQEAIIATLTLFFKEESQLATDIEELQYTCAIFNTVDPNTGQKVSQFNLSSPTGDIVVGSGELALLGAVNFI